MSSRPSKALLDGFWRLPNPKPSVRIDAAANIVHHAQAASEDAGEYVLTRFVKGLASAHDCARQGYFVAFVEHLRRCGEGVVVDKVLELVAQHLAHSGSKSEEGDNLCGQLFTYGALLKSGICTFQRCADLIKDIVKLSDKRSYLILPAFKFIVDYLEKVESDDVSDLLWPALLEVIEFKRETLTLEHIWLLLTVRKTFPGVISKKFFPNALGRKKLVCAELCEDVARNLNATSIPINILRRHPVFPILIEALKDESLLKSFWIDHINPFLTKNNGSPYKTLLAFGILSVTLESVGDEGALEEYLTAQVIESALAFLSRIESSPDDDAKLLQVLGKFCEKAATREEMQVPILKAFLTEPGSVCFDKLTGGALVHKLIMECKPAAVKFVAESLLRPAVLGQAVTGSGQHRSVQERVYAAQQLAKLTSHPAMQEDLAWKRETIKFLLGITLFKVDKKSKVTDWVPEALSRESLTQMRGTFFKSLDFKTKSLDDVCNLLMEVFEHAKDLKEKVPLAYPLNEKSEEAWESVVKKVSVIAKRRMKEGKKEDAVFLLFFVHMAFHLLSDQEMACEMLEELHECHQRSTVKSKRKSVGGEKEPHWVEVVTDLLISLQSQNQLALRHLASSVFRMICTNTTTESLQAILDVIDVAEESKDEDGNDEEDEGWEDMSSDDEESAERDEEDASASEEDTDDDEDDDDEKADADNEPAEEFKKKVRAALGDHAAPESSDESGDDDDKDDDDVDMDDIPQEDLDKMDAALANVFRQLSGGKKSGSQLKAERKAATAKVHFRVRCLDLLDVYFAQEPKGVHVILALQRIMSALERSKSKAEEDFRKRLLNSLKKIAGLRKNLHQIDLSADDGDGAQGELFVSVLRSLVELANRGSPLIATLENPIPLYAQCCFLVLKIGQLTKDEKVNRQMEEIYVKAVDDFFKHSHCLLPATFFSIPIRSNWSGSFGLASKIKANAFNPSLRLFRRTQALSLLLDFFATQRGQKDASKEVGDMLKEVEHNVVEELRSMKAGDVRPKFLHEMLRLLHLAVSTDSSSSAEAKAVLEEFRERIPMTRHSTDVKKTWRKLAQTLGISQAPVKNPQANVTNGVSNSNTASPEQEKSKKKKKKKKKGRSNEVQQERKRQRELELSGQFEGMEIPSFAQVDMTDNLNFKARGRQENGVAKKKAKRKSVEESEECGGEDVKSPKLKRKSKKI